MLHRLPVDIALLVLEDFVGCHDFELSILDVAFCSHEDRRDWLDLLVRLRTVEMGGRFYRSDRTMGQMTWALARKLRIRTLSLHPIDVDQDLVDLVTSAGPAFLESVRTLRLLSQGNDVVGPTFRKFLSLFPALWRIWSAVHGAILMTTI